MKPLGAFLARFRALKAPGEALEKALHESIADVCGTPLPPYVIRVRGAVAFIQGSSALASEIALKKTRILEKVREKVGKGLSDIR